MIDLTTYIYTLKTLASIEDVSPDYLRLLIFRLQKEGKDLEWRSYRFYPAGQGKAWLAIPRDSDIEIK